MAAQCPIVGISETFPCFLTLLGPAYLSISKDRGGAHCAPPNVGLGDHECHETGEGPVT